jgi:peptidoglycan/LPS O-acetylase OafA/YrhL
VFHPFASYFLRFLCVRSASFLKAVREMPSLYFILLLGLSIGVAHLSYRFYERRFLRMKERMGPA